ncbi:MAG: hypothetical protein ACYTFW_25465 [Planctomycetota bacterium]|jgi:hypothetical protein
MPERVVYLIVKTGSGPIDKSGAFATMVYRFGVLRVRVCRDKECKM